MSAILSMTDGTSPWRLEGEFNIYTAAELKPQLLVLVRESLVRELDLSAVHEIDTAGLQLLIQMKREAARIGKALHYVAHSAAVIESMELCKLEVFFGDQVVMASASAA
jgi:anti-anti-sigma factor